MIPRAALLLGLTLLAAAPSPSPSSRPAPPPSTSEALAVVDGLIKRNAPIRTYTFNVSIHVVLHSFPGLRFHLSGDGRYERPSLFSVHFNHVPWFGKGFERIDIGPLDPKNWPDQYTMQIAERRAMETVLALHDRKETPLTGASAVVDAVTGVRQLVWTYDYGGRIEVNIVPKRVGAYELPASEVADIAMPHYHATATAEFSNYRVASDDGEVLDSVLMPGAATDSAH